MGKRQIIGNLALSNFGDIFNVGVENLSGERIMQIPLADLYPPDFHPFQVNDDDAMTRLAGSDSAFHPVCLAAPAVRRPGR